MTIPMTLTFDFNAASGASPLDAGRGYRQAMKEGIDTVQYCPVWISAVPIRLCYLASIAPT